MRRRLIRALLLTLAVICFGLTLSSCQIELPEFLSFLSKDEEKDVPIPELDLEKAADNLEAAGYVVHLFEITSTGIGVEKELNAYIIEPGSDEGLGMVEIKYFFDEELAELYYERLIRQKSVQRFEIEKELNVLEYLKKHPEIEYEDRYMDIDEAIEYYEEQLDYVENGYVIGIEGKYVFIGERSAIEATKG